MSSESRFANDVRDEEATGSAGLRNISNEECSTADDAKQSLPGLGKGLSDFWSFSLIGTLTIGTVIGDHNDNVFH